MKIFIFSVVLIIFLTTSSYADVFQFVDRHRNSYLVSYGVYISGQLSGYTDGYGRIRIDIPNGTYNAILKMPNRPDRSIELKFNDSNRLKIIYVP